MNTPRTRHQIVSLLINPGVIAVVRGPGPDPIPGLIEALIEGGVLAIEITLTTPDALLIIREARARYGTSVLIGVGTVLDVDSARTALDAGAEFVVTPVLRPEIVPVVHAADRPVMLGAYSPTEAHKAHEAGADFVKLFPADTLGPDYVKALLAPLPRLRLVPTGGVDPGNAGAFIRAGCSALGAGSSLVPRQALLGGHWRQITDLARRFVEEVRRAREDSKPG